MAFTVIYDANVLYPAPLRDLLVRLGQTRHVRIRWTDDILDEVFRNIVADRPDLDPDKRRDPRRARTARPPRAPDRSVDRPAPRLGARGH